MNKLNRLERAILQAEDSAEDARWAQAEEVVRRLGRGETQREIAATWTNLREGKPYSQTHVGQVARTWRAFEQVPTQDRPVFWRAVASLGATTREERRESEAPKTVETAEKLVQNLAKADDKVLDTVYHGLREARAGKYVPPAERKARHAAAVESTKPLRQAVGNLTGSIGVVSALSEATELLREMNEDDAITADTLRKIEKEHDTFVKELEFTRVRLGSEVQ